MEMTVTATHPPEELTLDEAAAYLGVSRRAVNRLRGGGLDCRRVPGIPGPGGGVRIPFPALTEYIATHTIPAAERTAA